MIARVQLSCSPPTDVDPLEKACRRYWSEICGLMPRHRFLLELGAQRSSGQEAELLGLTARVLQLRQRTRTYREILRQEALLRAEGLDPCGSSGVVLEEEWG